MTADFEEYISLLASEDDIADHVRIHVDSRGDFVTVETDEYEGHAMMTLAAARKVCDVLA